MDCGVACARFLLIVFNVIFWLSGVAILGVGIWLRVDESVLELIDFVEIDESDPLLKYAALVLIAVGSLVFVVGFVGCLGALKVNKFLLGLYFFFLFLVLAGELAAGIMAFVYQRQIDDKFMEEWHSQLSRDPYANMSTAEVTYTGFGLGMNLVQWRFDCCGVHDINDYNSSSHWPKNDSSQIERPFPFTCCKLAGNPDDPREVQMSEVKDIEKCYDRDAYYVWTQGCYDGLIAWFHKHATLLGAVGVGIASLEILGMLLAFCLCRALDMEESDW